MSWRVLPPHFDANVDCMFAQIGHQNLADQSVEMGLVLDDRFELGRERARCPKLSKR